MTFEAGADLFGLCLSFSVNESQFSPVDDPTGKEAILPESSTPPCPPVSAPGVCVPPARVSSSTRSAPPALKRVERKHCHRCGVAAGVAQ